MSRKKKKFKHKTPESNDIKNAENRAGPENVDSSPEEVKRTESGTDGGSKPATNTNRPSDDWAFQYNPQFLSKRWHEIDLAERQSRPNWWMVRFAAIAVFLSLMANAITYNESCNSWRGAKIDSRAYMIVPALGITVYKIDSAIVGVVQIQN